MTVDERIAELRTECDNYLRALQALKALTHELLWDPVSKACNGGSVAHFGRRMHTSAKNRISPMRKVTPDMVGQPTSEAGFAIEVKASVPSNEEYRRQKIIDVQRYDDDLTGWNTTSGKLQSHDVVLMVDYANSQVVRRDLQSLTTEGKFRYDRPFALVSFTHQARADATWVALHLLQGQISDTAKSARLEQICMIHPENVEANPLFGRVLLYDAAPPLPLLMIRLYESIISNLNTEENLRLRTEGQLAKTLTLTEMKDLLADYCCPEQTDSRVPKLPETAWIKSALRMWVQMDWAAKSPSTPKAFDIMIRKTRREPFEQFLKVCAENDCKEEQKREKEMLRQKKLDDQFRQKFPLLAFAADQGDGAPAAPADMNAGPVASDPPTTPTQNQP